MAFSSLRSSLLRALGATKCSSESARLGRVMCRGCSDEASASDIEESVAKDGDQSGRKLRAPAFQGVYKAVIVGELTQPPAELVLKNGNAIVTLMVATGGLRVQKKLNAPTKQIHKVVVYHRRLKDLATQIKKGQQIYLEGNMESRVFNDPVTGAVKLSREISVRQNGRLFMLDDLELRGVNLKAPKVEEGNR
ncbi:hypothetical protein SELMODRAFT_411277 [Selaginella moellendorffii]|uniref:Uncharacterized protein n=1 Tax=Selaginella moellendorffii TaxID=88036 RepID=D8RH51_SELML|nr:single-stranded DNA-binding protein, mitochondrial [Selaginella moellendorffii]EFJ28473.1 hypothetical protein SELMODRAFT_411277 [Selaginella moellendorffii]|eukprot:XP_002970343.1 single-stranded DNA-binding protein, mitochondrial [Selaginella moellendorffii]